MALCSQVFGQSDDASLRLVHVAQLDRAEGFEKAHPKTLTDGLAESKRGRQGADVPDTPPTIFSPRRRAAVSRRLRHLQARPGAARFVLEDMGSTNGTYLNGRTLKSPERLKMSDIVRIGDSEYRYQE